MFPAVGGIADQRVALRIDDEIEQFQGLVRLTMPASQHGFGRQTVKPDKCGRPGRLVDEKACSGLTGILLRF
jgi:hypothetical protein